MTDNDNVIDLEEKRAERSGAGFWLAPWDYDDDALGFIPGDFPVVFVTTREETGESGICMTRETARKLRDALTEVIDSPHAPWASEVPT